MRLTAVRSDSGQYMNRSCSEKWRDGDGSVFEADSEMYAGTLNDLN